jgi:hypothetical protein
MYGRAKDLDEDMLVESPVKKPSKSRHSPVSVTLCTSVQLLHVHARQATLTKVHVYPNLLSLPKF